MAFDWREYLDLARFLTQPGTGFTEEAALRCAMSRAYYAAFCHARNYARDRHGFAPSYDPSDHKLVRDHFRGQGMNGIARTLNQLRQWRNLCDYTDTLYNLPTLAPIAIAQAQQVFTVLS
jgi:hypothetical protein